MITFLGFGGWDLTGALPTSGTRFSTLAVELPQAITPTVAGLTVGAFVGVVGFIAVLLLVGKGSRRGTAQRIQAPADRVVFIPPYGTLQRDTPLPQAAFQIPPQQRQQSQPSFPHAGFPEHAFRPSTDLSARAFAKMRMGSDAGPESGTELSIDCEISEAHERDMVVAPPPVPPVSVSAILVVEESGGIRAADKSAPHPLGIIPSGSSAMQAAPRAASFAELDMDDDGKTEIAETYFDEPPQPRRRSEPPKIRPVAPSGPRFPVSTQHLPQPTPPPARAVPSARG